MLFDTHAHLDDPRLLEKIESVILAAESAGLAGILAVATTAASAETCVALAERFEIVYAAVGIQPNHVGEIADGDWQTIRRLATHPKVRAIGETGLDHYWNEVPLAQQRSVFADHIALSLETQLPLVIHMRESQAAPGGSPCGREIIDQLSQIASGGALQGIMHSFTGTADIAAECLQLGLHISFAGMVTYKKSQGLRDAARTIPGDRLLVETDSPYLSPEPVRGQRPNEPAMVVHTAACLAESLGIEFEDFCRLTTDNAQRLFGIV